MGKSVSEWVSGIWLTPVGRFPFPFGEAAEEEGGIQSHHHRNHELWFLYHLLGAKPVFRHFISTISSGHQDVAFNSYLTSSLTDFEGIKLKKILKQFELI